jgi:hypothetical protein
MTNDLTTRLRAYVDERESAHGEWHPTPSPLMREAADRIEALEAQLDGSLPNVAARDLADALAARDAVIAEALKVDVGPNLDWPDVVGEIHAILSRVPQGAAEPSMTFSPQAFARAAGVGPTEPWTDPKPWLNGHGSRLADNGVPPRPSNDMEGWQCSQCIRHEVPRSREQYAAEEGNRG